MIYEATLNGDTLRDALEGVTALIVRSTKVTAEIINSPQAAGLKMIIRAGAGVDNIDLEAASAKKIFVCNCPGKNSVAVAELAFGMLLSADRRLVHQVCNLKEG